MNSFFASEGLKKWHTTRQYLRHFAARAQRSRRRLPLEDWIQTVDQEAVAKIARQYYGAELTDGRKVVFVDDLGKNRSSLEGLKYVKNVSKSLRTAASHALDLDLDIAPPQRILDLGCGAGYFLYVNQLLGHDCLGLDAPFVPAYQAITDLLGVKRVTQAIQPFTPLPDFGKTFDVITAFRICFDSKSDDLFNSKGKQAWGPEEWDFFLNDVRQYLAPGGLLQLRLNRRNGTCYTPQLLKFFLARGAEVYRATVRLPQSCLSQTQFS